MATKNETIAINASATFINITVLSLSWMQVSRSPSLHRRSGYLQIVFGREPPLHLVSHHRRLARDEIVSIHGLLPPGRRLLPFQRYCDRSHVSSVDNPQS